MTGLLALAIAMGIGRFAFTPLLPMMLHDGVIDLAGAGWLASVNYLGYLVGALGCMLQPWLWRRLGRPAGSGPARVRGGLLATATLTLAMALPLPALWPLLRFLAGVASAVVFVFCSGWCLAQLARRGAPSLGGVMYAGPGVGIAATGLFASGMVQWHWRAATGWAIFGSLALALGAAIWWVLQDDRPAGAGAAGSAPARATVASDVPAHPAASRFEVATLALAYGLAGYGYIVTATFLPVIARLALPGSAWIDLFWPIFGVGVCVGALIASRAQPRFDLRLLLVGCYFVQAVGIGVGLAWPSRVGFALGSFLLGLPFTVLTFYAMQEVRRLRPDDVPSTMGLLTAIYGGGQIVGPLLATGLLHRSSNPARGFSLALATALAALLGGATLYAWMSRRWPVVATVATTAR